MKKDREGMFFCLGIISLIVAIISSDISAMIVFTCITILCFYKDRKMIFKMFSKPIIRRIVKLKIKESEVSKELEERSMVKQEIDNYILNNENTIKEIQQYQLRIKSFNMRIDKMQQDEKELIREYQLKKEKMRLEEKELIKQHQVKMDRMKQEEKQLNGRIFELHNKKSTLEGFMKQEQIITRAIDDKKQLLEIVSDKTSYLDNQKKKLQTELSDLREKIIPLQKRIEFSLNTNLDYVDSLTGIEFEHYFSKLLFFLGYQSNCTNATADYGLDVIAIKDGIKYGFQCKLYSQNVGNDAVQEALSGKLYYNCHVAIVVTNNYFTHNAIKQAEKSNVVLWDRDKLEEILEQFNNEDIYVKN